MTRWILVVASAAVLSTGCSRGSAQQPAAAAVPLKPKLGIRPAGDETIKADRSMRA